MQDTEPTAQTTGKRAMAFVILLLITLVSTLGAVGSLKVFPFLQVLEAWVGDFRIANLAPAMEKHKQIVVVTITEDTLKKFPYRSPVDRHFLSLLLRDLETRGVRAIGIDLLFDQPTEPDKDQELKQTLQEIKFTTRLAVAYAGRREGLDEAQVAYLDNFVSADIRAVANLAKDPFDGIVRSMLPGQPVPGGAWVRGLAQAVAGQNDGLKSTTPVALSWRGKTSAGKRSFVTYPAHAIGIIPAVLLKDRFVLIGADLTLTDLHRTPFSAGFGQRQELETPGVFIHAHALAQLLDNQGGAKLPGWVELILVFLVTLAATALSLLASRSLWRILLSVGLLLLLWLAAFATFAELQLLIPLVTPTFSVAFSMWLAEVWFGRTQRLEKNLIRTAFSHYLSADVVKRLIRNPGHLRLGGEKRELSILFCDVRDFTAISERLDPLTLTHLINDLLTPLSAIILDHMGTVDKYMGDCIMAFWNAPLEDPDHARNACLSALAMIDEMGPLNERLAAEARHKGEPFQPLRVGVGVNSSNAVVGNMGSEQRFDYSVLGDGVNLASRLEGLCKTYGVDIIIGENTRVLAPEMAALDIDLVRVKGKQEPTRIFVLLGDETLNNTPAFKAFEQAHNAMLEASRKMNWDQALELLETCRTIEAPVDLTPLHDYYEANLKACQLDPPGDDWDGVYVATSK